MLRIKDPAISIPFYRDVLGMTLLHRYDYEAMDFSLYFLGYEQELVGEIPPEGPERTEWIFSQTGTLELTHNWGTDFRNVFWISSYGSIAISEGFA